MDLSREKLDSLEQLDSNEEYLNSIAELALRPDVTRAIFTIYWHLIPDICARWIYSTPSTATTATAALSAFARFLPYAGYLGSLAEHLLPARLTGANPSLLVDLAYQYLSARSLLRVEDVPALELQSLLLASYRLLQFDRRTYIKLVSLPRLQQLFHHPRRHIRYLAIRVLCLFIQAADGLVQEMLAEHLGADDIIGPWEDRDINYRFLPLWEDRLAADMRARRNGQHAGQILTQARNRSIGRDDLSPWTGNVCGVLLPRLSPATSKNSPIVMTPTTVGNLKAFARSLSDSFAPVLITGPAGSGKSASVNHVAQELGAAEGMLTLHLNTQTDAKALVGLYTGGSEPGKFVWRPGVLSVAVQEGRWVFIEDLDRAPADVLELLMPVLSDRKLEISNRGKTIHAASTFRLIATIRTSAHDVGQGSLPPSLRTGCHIWTRVHLNMPESVEYREIIASAFPRLQAFVPAMMKVFESVTALGVNQNLGMQHRSELERPTTLRDLIRWCRRLDHLLDRAVHRHGSEPISESMEMDMFAEANDTFAGHRSDPVIRDTLMRVVGKEMRLSPNELDYYSRSYTPRYEDTQNHLNIGRASLPRDSAGKVARRQKRSSDSFVPTRQTLRTLEQLGAAVQLSESVLLVGETGTGKTAIVQHLAGALGHKLIVINMSQQSESGDLIGSFKPINTKSLVAPLREDFDYLFISTFPNGKNDRFLDSLKRCLRKEKWSRVLAMWKEAMRMADAALQRPVFKAELDPKNEAGPIPKRRKLDQAAREELRLRWQKFHEDLKVLEKQLAQRSPSFAFKFMEGSVVRAARNGDWLLLDEINLATPDVLEGLVDLFSADSNHPRSILLSESGEAEKVQAHPDFRIFGAMNPATDIGKRDLPNGIRSRFFELYVDGPDKDYGDLVQVVAAWLGGLTDQDGRMASDIARFYLATKELLQENRLADNMNGRPHFSLRTLTRTLTYVTEFSSAFGIRRAMLEAFSLSFLTHLDRESQQLLSPLINEWVIGARRNPGALSMRNPRPPTDGRQYLQIEDYWMPKGAYAVEDQSSYIITSSVRQNLRNLIRAMSTRRFPILIQGPTSSGKTSMVSYLAKITGNKLVRINNHEHTDLQEYVGTYSSDTEGQLRFQEGILVRALRQGHWIVLDELNLAPTDILEALNRLLDDNRELMIPETQELVKPHPDFVLFATQNPAGLYGGRKYLSRAFRNRFIELYFGDIPENELETIIRERTQIAPSYAEQIVRVYKELLLLRQSERLFEQRHSFVTLRDLFRWASRRADTREQLALHGFMLVAERVRKPQERTEVKTLIERVFKMSIDEDNLYNESVIPHLEGCEPSLIWTKAMRRLLRLVHTAVCHDEPVLLIGETGCGKTSLCQALAAMRQKKVHIVNAQQNTETGDIIGSQRPLRSRVAAESQLSQDFSTVFSKHLDSMIPVDNDLDALRKAYGELNLEQMERIPSQLRQRIDLNRTKSKALFEWSDGALVQAMKNGDHFLLDEISLADDSVLERLNSVLEPERTILLAEKGAKDPVVHAKDGFQFFATMNPGGDFGKRELSPALRNRFTEIWVPPLSDEIDVLQIVQARLAPSAANLSQAIVSFSRWFRENFDTTANSFISVRHILAWVDFVNRCPYLDSLSAYSHGAALVFIDTLGANPASLKCMTVHTVADTIARCLDRLGRLTNHDISLIYHEEVNITLTSDSLQIGRFSITRKRVLPISSEFKFHASTTKTNAMRILRAMQLPKPILLEGSPGVGKTSIIAALADLLGTTLTRINLSEQTDLMDLFGTDVPTEGVQLGSFKWREGPFLQAMRKGEWVLLDEMNLASQSVLEGLNSCFDHRGEVFVSELNQSFTRHPDFRVFATQNPHLQGAGRKGLPASFVNRFSVVYADDYTEEDMKFICKELHPRFPLPEMVSLLKYMRSLHDRVVVQHQFGSQGGPWDFNLRDMTRWLQLLTSRDLLLAAGTAADFLPLIISQRFRSQADKDQARTLFGEYHGTLGCFGSHFQNLSSASFQVGLGLVTRDEQHQGSRAELPGNLQQHHPITQSIMICVQQNWPCILVGNAGSGKRELIRFLASVTGASLVELAMHSGTDTMDFVGGYEQMDAQRQATILAERVRAAAQREAQNVAVANLPHELLILLEHIETSSGVKEEMQVLHDDLTALYRRSPSAPLLGWIEECEQLSQLSNNVQAARFGWVDGPLVKAIEQGAWVILRDANLCSPSVLDRLNSLLEPNGSLIVNEHESTHGKPLAIKPHPNFRIFVTMDPRHGELSRAMRNRSVELYVMPTDDNQQSSSSTPPKTADHDSKISHYRSLTDLCRMVSTQHEYRLLLEAGLVRISFSDVDYLEAWGNEMLGGLLSGKDRQRALEGALRRIKRLRSTCNNFDALLSAYLRVGASHKDLPKGFIMAQAIDAIQNQPLLSLSDTEQTKRELTSLACLHDIVLEAFEMEHQFELAHVSLRAIRNPASEPQAASRALWLPFLGDVYRETLQWAVQAHSRGPLDLSDLRYARKLTVLWYQTLEKTFQPERDLALSRAYLQVWSTISAGSAGDFENHQCLTRTVSLGLQQVACSWQLETGFGMERIWMIFRPPTPRTWQSFNAKLRLESLGSRFDSMMWKSRQPLGDVIKFRESVGAASFRVLSNDGDWNDLVHVSKLYLSSFVSLTRYQQLEKALEALEKLPDSPFGWKEAYFQDEFEALSQYYDILSVQNRWQHLKVPSEVASVASFFGKRPSVSPWGGEKQPSVELFSNLSPSSLFAKLVACTGLVGSDRKRYSALQGMLAHDILRKTEDAGDVPLRKLDLLRFETRSIGEHIGRGASVFSVSLMKSFSGYLAHLLTAVFLANMEYCTEIQVERIRGFERRCASGGWQLNLDGSRISTGHGEPSERPRFQAVASQYLTPSLELIEDYLQNEPNKITLAKAWILFAIGSLILYVPNQPCDPSLRGSVQRSLHKRLERNINARVRAAGLVENVLAGQTTNPKMQLLEDELRTMGDCPEDVQVHRPATSELDALQVEFDTILSAVVKPALAPSFLAALTPAHGNSQQMVETLRSNVSQVARRLFTTFRAYDDMTAPIVGLLASLDLGLVMASLSHPELGDTARMTLPSRFHIPFIGEALQDTLPNRSEGVDPASSMSLEALVETLRATSILTSMEGVHSLGPSLRSDLISMFQALYFQWKRQVESEQKDAAAKTGLYRYRGDSDRRPDDALDDVKELFPSGDDFDHSKEDIASEPGSLSSMTSTVAGLHSLIFSDKAAASDRILEVLRTDRGGENKPSPLLDTWPGTRTWAEGLLPSLMIKLDFLTQNLSSTPVDLSKYDFYWDANLHESAKLMELTRGIHARFSDLRDSWPEHATLLDVLLTCEELSAFRHRDPIARSLTKAEKLYGYMHEWQRVASKEFSAGHLFTELTTLLVSWRRLELQTWARLFEIEEERCEKQAASWWFLAYEAVVAMPLSQIREGSDLSKVAQSLSTALESFFSTATIGQFSTRVRLLRQLGEHIAIVSRDLKPMEVIRKALGNSIDYYADFAPQIAAALSERKRPLEREIKEVITLASWKDINITALRESARRSHQKLCKVVRKYRAVLGEPATALISKGLPLIPFISPTSNDAIVTDSPIQQLGAAQAGLHTPAEWLGRLRPWMDSISNEDGKRKGGESTARLTNVVQLVDTFGFELSSSVKALQDETPHELTEENRMTVNHLKTRKRKLFAETLRALRQMGFQHNLGTDSLASQRSLAVILGRMESLQDVAGKGHSAGNESYFHRFLDLVQKARQATHEPCQELTPAEVARSVGYLEGLLAALLSQRGVLANALHQLSSLSDTVKSMVSASAARKSGLLLGNQHTLSWTRQLRQRMEWLPQTIDVGLRVLEAQNRLAMVDAPDVTEHLTLWQRRVETVCGKWRSSTLLPKGVTTDVEQRLRFETEACLVDLCGSLDELGDRHPRFRYLFEHIVTMARPDEALPDAQKGPTASDRCIRLQDLTDKMSALRDGLSSTLDEVGSMVQGRKLSRLDQSWLLGHGEKLSTCLHIFDIPTATSEARQCLDGMIYVDGQDLDLAAACIAEAVPDIQQYCDVYSEIVRSYSNFHQSACRLGYLLANTCNQLLTQGFCTPSEPSDAQGGEGDKVEGGTGLGEGEGAQDISKDIKDDESLTDVAREPNLAQGKEELKDEKDAVQMADDMEGEVGEDSGTEGDDKSGDDASEEGSIDDKLDSVDDLDPNSTDEKVMDKKGDSATTEQSKEQSKGKEATDDQLEAAKPDEVEETGEKDEAGSVENGADEAEETSHGQPQQQDPFTNEDETLDLPEDMMLDGDKVASERGEDDDIGTIASEAECGSIEGSNLGDVEAEDDPAASATKHDNEEPEVSAEEEMLDGEKVQSPDQEEPPTATHEAPMHGVDDGVTNLENTVSDDAGTGYDPEQKDAANKQAALDDAQDANRTAARGDQAGKQSQEAMDDAEPKLQAQGQPSSGQERQQPFHSPAETQAFRKLGDALDRWQRRARTIMEASDTPNKTDEQRMPDGSNDEVEHLRDEEDVSNAQALGAATEEQARAVGQSGIVEGMDEQPQEFLPDEETTDASSIDDHMELDTPSTKGIDADYGDEQGLPRAFIGEQRHGGHGQEEFDDDLEDVDVMTPEPDQSEALQVSGSAADAHARWARYENHTRDLSLVLTEQLRLILNPTVASKFRGDYRTGKRLNIKRIIPYIASGYKRDKIWMRRSVPNRRNYQIMLAVDDSKSMAEGGAGNLALETLVMVSRSLSMLEVGQISVVAFGQDVKVAHSFEQPFHAGAGPGIFQHFSFQQTRTDVKALLSESLPLFRSARLGSTPPSASSVADPWQLMLIISDGICEDHGSIGRLVRQAKEERIMIVFIIVDDHNDRTAAAAAATSTSTTAATDPAATNVSTIQNHPRKSILDMTQAVFETLNGDGTRAGRAIGTSSSAAAGGGTPSGIATGTATGAMKVTMRRYLDTFPFPYYLVVGDVKALPGVLATALRQWFREVVDTD